MVNKGTYFPKLGSLGDVVFQAIELLLVMGQEDAVVAATTTPRNAASRFPIHVCYRGRATTTCAAPDNRLDGRERVSWICGMLGRREGRIMGSTYGGG
jgi:hypothetical protein